MNNLFVKVAVSERLPDTHFETYTTDKGELFDIDIERKGAAWWLEPYADHLKREKNVCKAVILEELEENNHPGASRERYLLGVGILPQK